MSETFSGNPEPQFVGGLVMQTCESVTAMILAGGLGTCLRSSVGGLPKVLAPVNDRPFLSYLLDQLLQAGFSRVILCTGYGADQIEKAFGEVYENVTIEYSREPRPLGTGGALRYASPRIGTSEILVMNGDSFINADLIRFMAWYFEKGLDAALLLKYLSNTSQYGRIEIDNDGRVRCFKEKAAKNGPGLINAGVYVLKRSLLELIPSGSFFSLERGFLTPLVGGRLYGYRSEGDFIDIGTPKSYASANDFFRDLT